MRTAANTQMIEGAGGQSVRPESPSPPASARTLAPQPIHRRAANPSAKSELHTAGAISRQKTRSTPAMCTDIVITSAKEA